MGEDRSLDEFAGSDVDDRDDVEDDDTRETEDDTREADDDTRETEEIRDGEEGDESVGEATPDPAISTSTWTSGGADCEGCGETVTRRWLDDGAFVCADCKEW